ncbi:MAG: galactose mutarotase [Planctomycetota bacterium]|nr:galactose mutarotase [Planctomycetota bacterium]
MRPHVASFGQTAEGAPAEIFTLERQGGLRARVTTLGATLVELWAPDRRGELADVVLGFDTLAGYQSEENQYFGCTVGRCANRIAQGAFVLDGRTVQLSTNEGPHHLHGGHRGLDRSNWRARVEEDGQQPAVRFSTTNPAGAEGYPGTLDVSVTYALVGDLELRLDYVATCSETCPVNLTNHSYFNLAGAGEGTILGHELWIAAEHYLPVDDLLIPTGSIEPVAGTALDFRTRHPARPLGLGIGALEAEPSHGYDHNFVLDHASGELALAARLRDPTSGRTLELLTTEPGLQVYSGNDLHGQTGKRNQRYERHGAIALEAQEFPDAVHQPAFPPVILRPGQSYAQTTVYRFSAR